MCAEDLLAAGVNCIPLFMPTCIAEGLLENVECVECVADFDFSSLIPEIPNPFGWAEQKIEEEFIFQHQLWQSLHHKIILKLKTHRRLYLLHTNYVTLL